MPAQSKNRFPALGLLVALLGSLWHGGSAAASGDPLGGLREIDPGLSVLMATDGSRPSYLSGRLSAPSTGAAEVIAADFLRRNAKLFGLEDGADELVQDRDERTAAGRIMVFSQRHAGLEVVGGGVVLRIKDGQVRTVANRAVTGIHLPPRPTLSEGEALIAAANAVGAAMPAEKVDLVYFRWEGSTHLAYRVSFPQQGEEKPARYRAWIDAVDGTLLLKENRIMHNGWATGSGPGLDGQMKTFETRQLGRQYYLFSISEGEQDIKFRTHSADGLYRLPGKIVSDADNHWGDPAAVDAHVYAQRTLSFYQSLGALNWWPRSGFAKAGSVISTVHFGHNYDNAFWNGEQMAYGDGGSMFHPMSGAMDVVAHELTHGVTEAVNGLLYCKEPGALNESWSDVMAMFIGLANGEAQPYWMGEAAMKIDETPGYEAYYALRRMDDPAFRSDSYPENDYNPVAPFSALGQPAHVSEQYRVDTCTEQNDQGGVHINSGIPNRAAYLLTQAVGPEKARQIYYLGMFYLAPDAQFTDARLALQQAAADLFGAGSAEANQVGIAFEAVGIH